MASKTASGGLFPALLKHWRGRRGLSQLDLAMVADVSSRHVSFLETGRSNPSPGMVLRLAAALDVPLRHVNTMLRSAGHEPLYPESENEEGAALPESARTAIELMKNHHDPFPLVVIDRTYRVLDLNQGAARLFGALLPNAAQFAAELNLALLTFHPEGAHSVLVNFDEVGRELLWRIQREVLADPEDNRLRNLLDQLLQMPTVSDAWREADLTKPASPTLVLHLQTEHQEFKFLTMVTAFQAPQSIVLDELRIETWFPFDEATAEVCKSWRIE